MPFRCCVTGCKTNYDSQKEAKSIFKFPSDPLLAEKWKKAIPRKNFNPTKSSRVCEVHFKDTDIERETSDYMENGEKLTVTLRYPRLKKSAIPSIFPGCPGYLSSVEPDRVDPDERRERIENEQLNLALRLSKETKEKEDAKATFTSYKDFLNRVSEFSISHYWTIVSKADRTMFVHVDCESAPKITASVIFTNDMELKAYHQAVELHVCNDIRLPKKTNSFREISSVLEYVEFLGAGNIKALDELKKLIMNLLEQLSSANSDIVDTVDFLKEQIDLLGLKKEQRRYSSLTMIFSSLLYSISPHAYRFLRNSCNIIMPHPTTIRKISSFYPTNPVNEQTEETYLLYAKEKSKLLKDHEKIVTLMLDEIHIKPYFDYKGGNIVGMAFNQNDAATTAHVFMTQSLMSNHKDVVHILPVKTITAEALHEVTKKIVLGLEKIGYKVVAVISDNNAINRKCMSLFASPPRLQISYEHPSDPDRPLFFIIDTVHILKNIRNNWLNQRNSGQCMFYPNFACIDDAVLNHLETASFDTLRKLHEVEHLSLVKFGYGLTLKALNPTSFERQNVKLALQIFNEFVVKALIELGEKHSLNHSAPTASFIQTILNWWWVVNVKSPDKGQRLKNDLMYPLTDCSNDQRVMFLTKFLSWLDLWETSGCKTGTLTRETHSALKHTTHGILQFTVYCLNQLKMKYVLTGKLQTDVLEERFGKYRTLAGSQYSISVRQIYESESKLRLQDYLPLSLPSSSYGKIGVSQFDVDIPTEENNLSNSVQIEMIVKDSDFKEIENSLPVLVYMSGFCIYSVCKNLKCESCRDQLSMEKELAVDDCYSLVQSINRGGLQFPNADVVRIVSFCYIVAQKLMMPQYESEFLKVASQRSFMTKVILDNLTNFEIFNDADICSMGHAAEFIVRKIVWVATNILLKNYCRKKNDVSKKLPQKRKLQVFSNK